MAIAEVFPYSNQHDLNLDWVISKIKEFSGNQISSISCEQLDANTVKFVITYTDGTTRELTDVILPEGPQGPQGETGATPNLTAGTVTTLPAGSDATVSITGTAEDPVLNLGIPQGIQGETGATGAPGGITNIDGYTGAVTTGDGLAFSNGQLSSYDFNLTDTGMINNTDYTYTGVINAASSGIRYALNSDKSIGKIYGTITATMGTITQTTLSSIKTGLRVAAPSTAYDIAVGEFYRHSDMTSGANGIFIGVASDGEISIKFNALASASGKTLLIALPACPYFFKDFGDTPEANTLSMRMAAISQDPIEAQER